MSARIKCHCGEPLPCRKHSGDDGDTADYYNPDINEDNPRADTERMNRHEKN